MEIIRENSLGFYNDQGIFTIPAKRYDTGRIFKFNITDLCNDVDLSECDAYIRILKADGTEFQGNECTKIIDKNTILVDTSIGNGDQILAACGINKCELHITDKSRKHLTTWNFNINVEPRVHDGNGIVSKDSWDIADKLEEYVKDVEEAIADTEDAITDTKEAILKSDAQTLKCDTATQACETAAQNCNTAANEAANINVSATSDTNTFILHITNRNGTTTSSQNLIGDTPNLSVGNVQTGNEGTSAEVSITGTTKDPVLNFVIPKGDTGSIKNTDDLAENPVSFNEVTETVDHSIAGISTGSKLKNFFAHTKAFMIGIKAMVDLCVTTGMIAQTNEDNSAKVPSSALLYSMKTALDSQISSLSTTVDNKIDKTSITQSNIYDSSMIPSASLLYQKLYPVEKNIEWLDGKMDTLNSECIKKTDLTSVNVNNSNKVPNAALLYSLNANIDSQISTINSSLASVNTRVGTKATYKRVTVLNNSSTEIDLTSFESGRCVMFVCALTSFAIISVFASSISANIVTSHPQISLSENGKVLTVANASNYMVYAEIIG